MAGVVLDAVWRMEPPRLVAALTRIVRDVGLAEDLAQDAFAAALEAWPRTGVPDAPGAWLLTTARRRRFDALRRRQVAERTQHALEHDDRGGRPRLPRADGHRRPAHCPRQAHSRRRAGAVRGARRR